MTNHQFNLRFVTLILSRSLLLLVALLLAACAGTKYQQDFREGTNFENLNSYTWRKMNSEVQGVDNIKLQRLADQQLSLQGFTRTDSEPDMLLDMTLITRISTGSSTGIGLSVGIPIGRSGSIGLGGGKSVPNDKFEGVLLVDITEANSNTLIWRGSAEGVPMEDFSLKAEDKLAEVIAKLLAQFPPQQ